MSDFYYQGRDTTGQLIQGRVAASSADMAATQLLQDGIMPIQIHRAKKTFSLRELLHKELIAKRIKLTDLMLFCRQMYALIKAGVPLDAALKRLAESTRHTTLQKKLQAVRERINSGETLASALTHYPTAFSHLFVNVIRVGENTGRLDIAFLRLLDYLSLEESTLKRVKTAIRYPLFVMSTLFIALLVINVFVLPVFNQLFSGFHTQLPLATRILMTCSHVLTTYWLHVIIVTIFFGLALCYYVRTPDGRLQWHRWQRRIPILSRIITHIHVIRFARLLAMVLRAGVPLNEGLTLVGDAVGNAYVQSKVYGMQQQLERGGTLSHVVKQSELFSPMTWQMVLVGEETGHLDDMLEEVAGFYEREVDYELARLNDALEPILLLGIGVMVLILALGVFLPMWDVARLVRLS